MGNLACSQDIHESALITVMMTRFDTAMDYPMASATETVLSFHFGTLEDGVVDFFDFEILVNLHNAYVSIRHKSFFYQLDALQFALGSSELSRNHPKGSKCSQDKGINNSSLRWDAFSTDAFAIGDRQRL